MKSEPSPPMTLGSAAAAHLRLIVWCQEHCHRVEPDPAEMAERLPRRDYRAGLGGEACAWPVGAATAESINMVGAGPNSGDCDPARTALDPKRKVVATDSMSRTDVKRTLQVAVVDATTLGPVAALTAVLATCEKDASDGGRDGFQRPGTVRRLFFFRPSPIDGGRGIGCVGSVSGPCSEP
jgi:hypothetical protein